MKKLIILLILIFISCNKNKSNQHNEISFEIKNDLLTTNNLLQIKISNKSDKNYFIIIDTSRIYDYSTLNYKINSHIHLIPKFYLKNEAVNSYLQPITYKSTKLDTAQSNCIKKEMNSTQIFLNKLKKLENALILKKKSDTYINIPFSTNFTNCNTPYHYLLFENLKYEVQFEYYMNKEFVTKYISKSNLSIFKSKGIEPYYDEIVSNKIPLIINK